MNKILKYTAVVFIIAFIGCTTNEKPQTEQTEQNPEKTEYQAVDYVNPYIGNISHLLVPTFPTVHLPNSMLRLIPSRADYTTDRLNGLPLITTSHRGKSAFNLSPASGNNIELEPVYKFSYDNEKITPYSWQVYLDNQEINVAYGVSHQAGIYNIDFNDNETKYLLINNPSGSLKVEDGVVTGYQVISDKQAEHITKVYLYLVAEKTATNAGVLVNGKISKKTKAEGNNGCIALQFSDDTKQLKVKYGVSFISEEQAKANLHREIAGFNMDKVTKYGRKKWNEALSKIKVEGNNNDNKTVFYTSLYRTYERPVCISEDGRYYSAFDGTIHNDNGTPFYTDDWIWDTYRATHPLRCITEQEMELDIIKSFIRMAEQMENFWMPTFPEITGDSRRMNSNHGVATILDAYRKGLTDFDIQKAYKACKGAITEKTLAPWSGMKAGKLDEFYKENGYFPALHDGEEETIPEVHHFESRQPVAVTLGTVYDEWCLAQIAKIVGDTADYNYFLERSVNYRKIYNPETGFFHPKDDEGKFIEPFDYKFSGGMGARKFYGENNGWVYRWDVPHNVPDLIKLMGGNEQFVANLEATFNEPLGKSKYAFYAQLPDHTGNVGQFSMANEPSLHIPYLYNYAGKPWKTQKRIRKLLHEWFRNDLMGVPGDEDGGGMSAFVAFSQMGFYPVTPGQPYYTIGSPVFEKVSIDLNNGKEFTVIAKGASKTKKYIQKAFIDGEEILSPFITHEQIMSGATLELELSEIPNKEWGTELVLPD